MHIQYNVTGKWITAQKWYGSYAVRYNLKTMSFEVPWVKYKGCGPEEKILVELKRKDRLMFHNRPIYHHKELMIPPFVSMEKYLSEYENGFPMPQYSTNKPIKFSGVMKYL